MNKVEKKQNPIHAHRNEMAWTQKHKRVTNRW